MKRMLLTGLIVALGLSLLGMGRLDSDSKPEEIPTPDRDVTAVIADVEGLTLTLSQFSINGQTVLSGKMGAGKAAVLFSQIKTVTLTAEAKTLRARVELTDQQTVNLILDRGLTAYGRTRFGAFQIPLDQLKKIEILTVTEKKK
ncbi:MAG: hypothetical protein MUF69_04340 [Desulfobacterota bacterium]|jgi:hypothetical protein|nr:hypothetical protein [Thermodesulfobacteriota bacterium]